MTEHRVGRRIRRGVSVWLCALFVVAVPWHAIHADAAQPPAAAQDEFVPIDSLPPDEQLPAAPLLLAAYAAAWLVILVYLWSIWQRLGRVEREIAEVSRRLEQRSGPG